MAQTADSVSRAHGSSHLFAPRRLTLRGQSKQSLLLRFRPRLRRGSFVLTLIRGSLQMGHPWPSAAQSASMPIAPRISARTQPSPTSQSAVSALSRKKARQCRCLTGWPDDLCITMSAGAWGRSGISSTLIVPMLRVGMHPGTLRVPYADLAGHSSLKTPAAPRTPRSVDRPGSCCSASTPCWPGC